MSGLAIIYFVGKGADIKQKIFVYSLALAGVALNWQNVITGKILSFSPHYYTTMVLFLFIIFAFCVSMAWKNYKENSKKGFEQYVDALKLGYTKPIKEIYQTAGIKFDFSASYIKELITFIKKEIKSSSI